MKRSPSDPAHTSGKRPRRALKFVLVGHRRMIAMIATLAFVAGLLEALFLVMVTRAAFAVANGQDRIGILSGRSLSLPSALLLAVGLISIRMVLAAYAAWESANLSAGTVARIRGTLSAAFLDSSWEVQQAQQAGSLQELLTTYSGHASYMVSNLAQGVVSAANLVALLGMAVAVNPTGALVLVASVAVLALPLRPLRRVVGRRGDAANRIGMDFATSVNEVSELGLELHVFQVQEEAKTAMGATIERARRAFARYQFIAGLGTPVYTGLAYLAVVGALAVVSTSNTTSLTSLGAAMLVMLRSLGYGQGVQNAVLSVAGAAPAIDELQDRLEIFTTGRRANVGKPIGKVDRIGMDGVSFAYPNSKPVLRNVSFTIKPHETIGIVGPSGAGKSTLVQLLLGLREPDKGWVLADGRDIATFDRGEWARRVTFVPQAAHLIAGTVAENIRFFRPGVSQEDVERAARLAHLHDEIVDWAEGYEHQVGTHGGHLSGGQQQRLCIARALVEQPDVLILDEPTSALDVRSEHLVRSTLEGLKERMTVVVIAHRLSTLTICNRIMVIKDGELKDFDTAAQLERSSEFYREALALSGLR